MQKKDARKAMLARRKEATKDQLILASNMAANRLAQLPQIRVAKHIATFLATNHEIDISPTSQPHMYAGKNILAPVISRFFPREMKFYPLTNNLRHNRFAILEPIPTKKAFPLFLIDVILVPLVAFDLEHYRLGMGGGYYDKLIAKINILPKQMRPLTIGIAFDKQEIALVPREKHDKSLDYIVTESRLLCKAKS